MGNIAPVTKFLRKLCWVSQNYGRVYLALFVTFVIGVLLYLTGGLANPFAYMAMNTIMVAVTEGG